MLLQAMLDVAVDECIEITEEFRRELDILEGRALVSRGLRTSFLLLRFMLRCYLYPTRSTPTSALSDISMFSPASCSCTHANPSM